MVCYPMRQSCDIVGCVFSSVCLKKNQISYRTFGAFLLICLSLHKATPYVK